MKKPFILLSLFALIYITVLSVNSILKPKNITVGILQFVKHPALDKTVNGIIDELQNSNISNMQIKVKNAQSMPTMAFQIANSFVNDKVDIIAPISTAAAQSAVRATKDIPIVFSSVTDPIAAQLVDNLNNLTANVTGLSNYIDVRLQLDFYKKSYPKLEKLGIIYNPGEINSVKLLQLIKENAKQLNIEIISKSATKTSEVPQATSSIIKDVDAIFITNDNIALSAIKSIVNIANAELKPVFCSDIDTVSLGVTLAFGPDQYELGRQTGRIIIDILNGKKITDTQIQFPNKLVKKYNEQYIEKLNGLINIIE